MRMKVEKPVRTVLEPRVGKIISASFNLKFHKYNLLTNYTILKFKKLALLNYGVYHNKQKIVC